MKIAKTQKVMRMAAPIDLLFLPSQTAAVVNKVFAFLINGFGWIYLLSVAIFLVVAYGIAFSNYGTIKLGKDDDKPEFTFMGSKLSEQQTGS